MNFVVGEASEPTTIVSDYIIDNGLSALATDPDQILICSEDPVDYATAQSAKLGTKDYGAGSAFSSVAAGAPNGRKVTLTKITDGSVSADGTVTHWAAVDSGNSRLLARGLMQTPGDVSNGDLWGMASLDITIRSG